MRLILMLGVLTLSACGNNTEMASTNPVTNDVAARQTLMKDWRAATDTLRAMVDNPANFNTAAAQEQSQFLTDSTHTMWQHFADNSAKGRAHEAVWSDPTAFGEATAQFDAAVMALHAATQTATSGDDINPALGVVMESCGSCHKSFRQR